MRQQMFASPEEALVHFGVKGMRWGVRNEEPIGSSYSSADSVAHGHSELKLSNPDQLHVDRSRGFSDVLPVEGFASESARSNHEALVDGLEEMRHEYPNVANLKIEMVPMSHHPYGPSFVDEEVPAGILHVKPGEVQVLYNDRFRDRSLQEQKEWESWVPGMAHDNYLARHELGHILAASSEVVKPSWGVLSAKPSKQAQAFDQHQRDEEAAHFSALAKHGLSYPEVAKLSGYAATSPAEGLAELHGTYTTPALRRKMSPAMQKNAKALFDDLGGKSNADSS